MTASIEAPVASGTPNVAVNDIGDADAFLAAIDETIKYFNDGDIVEGVIVKVDRDEVLLDIGYKTEGVIPSRELSIKHDVDPNEVVSVGDHVEALVLQKEDKEGRLILSKKRAQYERAEVHDRRDGPGPDLALGERGEELVALLRLRFLEELAARQHDVVAILVELDDPALEILADVGGEVAHPPHLDQ